MRVLAPAVLLFAAVLICFAEGAVAGTPYLSDLDSNGLEALANAGRDRAIRELVLRQSQPLRATKAGGRQRRRLAGEKAPGSLRAIVMMCDFADSLLLGRHGSVPGSFPEPRQSDRFYAAHDSVFFDHMLSKVADYYTTVSGGLLDIQYTVHPRVVNLPEPMSFYGDHPQLAEQPILMAAQVVDSLSAEIDFSTYDTFILVHAGAGEETDILGNSPEQIFSTYLNPEDFVAAFEDSVLDQPYLMAAGFPSGEGIDRLLVLPETEQQDPVGGFGGGFGSLGVYCFEFGLHLGMLSLTDFTPAGRPDSQGIGQYGLMGYGLFVGLGFIPPHPCAYNKLLMGWIDPLVAQSTPGGRYQLTAAESVSDPLSCVRVELSGREYWLLEYRLQDPNGDRRFTFGDDKNGNGLPDFYDLDSTAGDGTPTGKFDAATDSLERVTEAEWDFAMSENSERAFGELGFGSGVYIWHIDEGVVQDVFDAPRNLFNADPQAKSVDLEEADGIQDLDSNQPSPFMLGSDDDSFRGESGRQFLPSTRPSTASSAGTFTGLAFRDFSPVVVDSFVRPLYVDAQGDTFWALGYADTMSFSLGRQALPGAGPQWHAQRELPVGTDVRGSHVLVGDLDQLGGTDEIIVAGQDGEIFVLDGDLNELVDRDGNPLTVEPFAQGTSSGRPVVWNLPPAMGDIDGDGMPEIVLTSPDGLYAFESDGTPTSASVPGAVGFMADIPGCVLPPVLVPRETVAARPDGAVPVTAVVVRQTATGHELGFISSGVLLMSSWVGLGPVEIVTAPAVIDQFIVVAAVDTVTGQGAVHIFERLGSPPTISDRRLVLPLTNPPGRWPLVIGVTAESDPVDPEFCVSVIDTAGHGETVFFNSQMVNNRDSQVWASDRRLDSPLGLGGAYTDSDILGRVGLGGDWLPGWPQRLDRPQLAGMPQTRGEPLVAHLVEAPNDFDQFVFVANDGRLFARGFRGEPVRGWPVAGPAATAGAAALGQLTGGPEADLVAVGTFDRVVGTASDGSLATEPITRLTVWRDVALADPLWPMAGGSIWRNGSYDYSAWRNSTSRFPGTGLVSGSHYCYPSPLTEGPLRVSGRVRQPARVRVMIYDLMGEKISETPWREVVAVDPFAISVDVTSVVTGLYLCRLVVDTPGVGSDESVVTFAIVR